MTPWMVTRQVPRSDPSVTIAKAARLVDNWTGIIRLVYENPSGPDAPAMFGYGSLLCDTTELGAPAVDSPNGSTSVSRAKALAGAIGEAVERYSARWVPHHDLLTGSFAELGAEALDPRSLVLYSDEQYRRPGFPYTPIHDDLVLHWVQGFSLTRRTPVKVPAFAVYIPYSMEGEPPIAELTTNGLACGNTMYEAVLSGLMEVVERHTAMSMWLSNAELPHLDCDTATDPWAVRTWRQFDGSPFEVHLLDGSQFLGLPVAISVAIDRSGRGPAATFASAANLSPERAIVDALEELVQCYWWLESLMTRRRAVNSSTMTRLSTVEDHVFWATSADNLPLVDFALQSTVTRPLHDVADTSSNNVLADLETAVTGLAAHGLETIVVDVTTPDIAEVDLHVARVIVPETQPLFFGYGLERIIDPLRTGPLNPWPHPFP
jgi:ribosomal protein S12 methylthiotransferase accessory factor